MALRAPRCHGAAGSRDGLPGARVVAPQRVMRIGMQPSAEALAQAADCVRSGGSLIFPTETVYGIGCAADAGAAAVDAIFLAKGRPLVKPLAVHIRRPADAMRFTPGLTAGAQAIADRFWPGPVAVIVERRAGICEAAARGGPAISLRCPSDPACAAILAATGPLAATSANLSGRPPFTGDGDVAELPDATLALIGGRTLYARESTLLDCTGPSPRLLREGALPAARVAEALEEAGLTLDAGALH